MKVGGGFNLMTFFLVTMVRQGRRREQRKAARAQLSCCRNLVLSITLPCEPGLSLISCG